MSTGVPVTVGVVAPVAFSTVAEIWVPPAATAVASPVPVMLATVRLELHQKADARPVSGLPAASSGTAVYCTVPPVAMASNCGVTLTDATGATTVIVAAPLLPPALAVIVAEPRATAG